MKMCNQYQCCSFKQDVESPRTSTNVYNKYVIPQREIPTNTQQPPGHVKTNTLPIMIYNIYEKQIIIQIQSRRTYHVQKYIHHTTKKSNNVFLFYYFQVLISSCYKKCHHIWMDIIGPIFDTKGQRKDMCNALEWITLQKFPNHKQSQPFQ